jgi:hypothetical protein
MNRKTAIILLLLTSLILGGIPQTFARPQYLTNLTAVYGDGSCETCHVMSSGSGQRDFNGTMPTNPNRTLDGVIQTGRYRSTLTKRPIDEIPIGHSHLVTQTGRYCVTLMELYLRTSLTTLLIQMQP